MAALPHCCQRFTYKPKVKAISFEVVFLCSVAHKAVCSAQRVFLPSLLRRLIVCHQMVTQKDQSCRLTTECHFLQKSSYFHRQIKQG